MACLSLAELLPVAHLLIPEKRKATYQHTDTIYQNQILSTYEQPPNQPCSITLDYLSTKAANLHSRSQFVGYIPAADNSG